MRTQHFGDISVKKVLDGTENFKATIAFPGVNLDQFHQHLDWIHPFYHSDSDSIIISTHSYVIKSPEFTAVVDTCIGNDKNRIGSGPLFKTNKGVLSQWNNRNSPYLDNLIESGVNPEEVDYVMCTHMHADHVGWNTKLENGHWVPTFPNAQYLFSQIELDGMLKQTRRAFSLRPADPSRKSTEHRAPSERSHSGDFRAGSGHVPGQCQLRSAVSLLFKTCASVSGEKKGALNQPGPSELGAQVFLARSFS